MSRNFFSLVEAAAHARPLARALAWDGGSLTWSELDARVGGAARALAARGVGAGDRVAISIANDARFVVALFAAMKLGATASPLNPMLKPDERASILADLAPAVVLEEIALDAAEWPTTIEASCPALILYTSGTTGRPKGAMLSHAALEFSSRSWAGPVMRLRPADVILAALPLAHSFGLNGALLAPLAAGSTVVILDRFTPQAVIDAIVAHRVTVLPGVATMFRRLLDAPAFARAHLTGHGSSQPSSAERSMVARTLRLAVSGAAPCPWELVEEWRSRTGVRLLRGYGMTELFRPISYLVDDPSELPESVGRPVPGVEVRIADERGGSVGAGVAGELLIRTPCAMDAYLGAAGETEAVLEDGWFRTGDLAVTTDDGFVCIVGRVKDLILRGGYSVFPQEVERVLATHGAVAEAAVIGVPDVELGEEVAAFVALRPGADVTAGELIAHCRERLAGYKYPRHVTFVERLPRTATGKVLKWELGPSRPSSGDRATVSRSLTRVPGGAAPCPTPGPTTA